MADDNMEIFSEHGQTAGDDIDIDIDFTGGQVDEDYILQDAQPSADYGNEFLPQQSPMHHDDPMIDDDSASYQMEDADLVHDEVVQDAEPEPMSFASSDIPISGGDIANAVDAITYSEDHDIGLFEEDDNSEFEGTEGGFVLVAENDSEGHAGSNAENVPVQVEYTSTDKVVNEGEVEKIDSQPESHGSTPSHRGSPATQEEPKEPRSPPASVSILAHSSPVYEPNGFVMDPENPREASVDTKEPDPSELALDFSKARDMKVVYQSVEYALFSTSESDDPDSFFLSDLTIMEKPLGQFFQAIREIIHDDLTAEDELCLNVEDLGLETEEASSTLQNVTLAQILSLHQKLLHNDGVDTPGPLYLLLGTRVNFSRRLSNLAGGASQGKGLSELVMRDENSESLDDADEEEIVTNGVDSSLRIHKTEDVEDEPTCDIENLQTSKGPTTSHQVETAEGFEEKCQHADGDEEFEEHPQGQDAENEADYQEDHEEQRIAQGEGEYREVHGVEIEIQSHGQISALTDHTHRSEFTDDDFKSHNGSQQSMEHTETAKPLLNPETVSGEDNEEEDLIDYSDEEIQFPDEPVRHRTAAVVDASRTDNEYQAKDEELRRRSISRQAEEKLLEQSIDQPFTITDDAEEEFVEETETGYDEYHTELSHEAQSDNHEFAQATDEVNLPGQEDDQIGLSNDLETFEDDEETYVYDTEGGVEVGNGGDDDIPSAQHLDEEAELQGIPPYTEANQAEVSDFEDINVMEGGHELPAPSTASSLAAAETAESSVTLGADEIQYDDDDPDEEISQEQEASAAAGSGNGSVLEQKDEIDYEDDEDEEIPISISSGATTASKVLSNSNGKRSIAEVESVLSTPTKDAKRPRS